MRLLVTGAAGFIGHALARRLASDPGNHVALIDNYVRGARDASMRELCTMPNVEMHELDLADGAVGERLPRGPFDVVFHLAALNGTQNFYERPYEVLRCSTLPTFALVDRYVVPRTTKRFIYAGSSEAYASTVTRFDWPVPTDESVPLCIDDPLNPRWSYGASKLHGEVLTAAACQEHGVPYTIIRYHNAFGPRMGDKHVVPDFAERMARGVYSLYGHEDTRSFLYVEDAVEATLRLARSDAASGQVVNVGSDREVTIRELAEIILRQQGIHAPLELHPAPKGSVRRRAPDLRKLRELTDFAPRWSLEDGLRATVDWYLREGRVPHE